MIEPDATPKWAAFCEERIVKKRLINFINAWSVISNDVFTVGIVQDDLAIGKFFGISKGVANQIDQDRIDTISPSIKLRIEKCVRESDTETFSISRKILGNIIAGHPGHRGERNT